MDRRDRSEPAQGHHPHPAEVAAEFADVVVAALVAVASLGVDPGHALVARAAAALRTRTASLRGVDRCATWGHDLAYTGWRMCACGRSLPDHADTAPDPAGGQGCGMAWRVCAVCEFVDKHHHITEHDDIEHGPIGPGGREVQPGGNLRQDVSAGLALPNHHKDSEENAMVEPSTAGGDLR